MRYTTNTDVEVLPCGDEFYAPRTPVESQEEDVIVLPCDSWDRVDPRLKADEPKPQTAEVLPL